MIALLPVLAAGALANPCVVPVPSSEERAASAGWLQGGTWIRQHEDINRLGAEYKPELVFLGDSISQGWGGPGRFVWQAAPQVWDRWFAPRHAASFGISGDGTQHVIWRIDHGNFDVARPRVIVLLIGVNNIPSHPVEQIAEGVQVILARLEEKARSSRVLLLGVFPFGQKPEAPTRQKVRSLNAMLSKLEDGKRVWFLDIGRAFLLSNGEANPELMAPDFLHLRPAGYEAWARAMEYRLAKLWASPPIRPADR